MSLTQRQSTKEPAHEPSGECEGDANARDANTRKADAREEESCSE